MREVALPSTTFEGRLREPAKPRDALLLVDPDPASDRVLVFLNAGMSTLRSTPTIEADLLTAVELSDAAAVAAQVRSASTATVFSSTEKPSGYRASVLAGSAIRSATGLTLALHRTEKQLLPTGTPVADYASQFPYLLDGAVVAPGSTVPVRLAGDTLRFHVRRATPSAAQWLRVSSAVTRITVEDDAAPPPVGAQPSPTLCTPAGASPFSAGSALYSPWKQGLGGKAALSKPGVSTPEPASTGDTPTARETAGSLASPPWKTPVGKRDKAAALPSGRVLPGASPIPPTATALQLSYEACVEPAYSDASQSAQALLRGPAPPFPTEGRQVPSSAPHTTPRPAHARHTGPSSPVRAPPPTSPVRDAALSTAGLERAYASLHELVVLPFTPTGRALLAQLRLDPPTGILLHGPPGCGKTHLVRSVAAAAGAEVPGLAVRTFSVGGPELMSPMVGEPERRLRALFARAHAHAGGLHVGGDDDSDEARAAEATHAGTARASGAGDALTAGEPASSSTRPTTPSGYLSLIFLDEVDALCPKRTVPGGRAAAASASSSSGSAVSTRLTTQLLTLMDGANKGQARVDAHLGSRLLHAAQGTKGTLLATTPTTTLLGRVVVIAATNRPDALDPALRRPGRLDREIRISPPDAAARGSILALHAARMPLSPQARAALPSLAERAIGYVGADLAAVCREAATLALDRALASRQGSEADSESCHALDPRGPAAAPDGAGPGPDSDRSPLLPCCVEVSDLERALTLVGASCLRGLAVSTASTPWSAIGGMDGAIASLRAAIELPLTHAGVYRAMGLNVPRGVLLHGPPGNAKTTLVRALATAARASFLSLSGADVFSPYVGEAEHTLREAFATARSAVPCVLFLDEVDALVGSRGIGGAEGGQHDVSLGVLATLLTEMDGLGGAQGIIVVGATNRPHVLDPALLRPGRMEVHVNVQLPDGPGRDAILRIHTRGLPLGPDVSVPDLAARTPGFSGAALECLVREAAMVALREDLEGATTVRATHFEEALRSAAATAGMRRV